MGWKRGGNYLANNPVRIRLTLPPETDPGVPPEIVVLVVDAGLMIVSILAPLAVDCRVPTHAGVTRHEHDTRGLRC